MTKIKNGKTKNSWIPEAFQKSAQTIAEDAVKQFVIKNNQLDLAVDQWLQLL
jgi:hypothetical protein